MQKPRAAERQPEVQDVALPWLGYQGTSIKKRKYDKVCAEASKNLSRRAIEKKVGLKRLFHYHSATRYECVRAETPISQVFIAGFVCIVLAFLGFAITICYVLQEHFRYGYTSVVFYSSFVRYANGSTLYRIGVEHV